MKTDCNLDPRYTNPDKFLNGQKLAQIRLDFLKVLLFFPGCGFVARSVAGATSMKLAFLSLGIRKRATCSKSKIRLSFTRTRGTMRVFERQILLQSLEPVTESVRFRVNGLHR